MCHVWRANRAFLHRAVRALCAQGIDQFLDIGSGLPTVKNVHETAQALIPEAHVVYVDYDPVTVEHSKIILDTSNAHHVAVVHGDARNPEAILLHSQVCALLDWNRPVGVIMLAVLHFIPDDAQALHAVQTLRNAIQIGSHLIISHGTHEGVPMEIHTQLTQLYGSASSHIKFRSRAEIAAFFEGFMLLEPGIVYLPEWRPDPTDTLFRDAPERSVALVGVGRKEA